jgi:hypothetical protein
MDLLRKIVFLDRTRLIAGSGERQKRAELTSGSAEE